MQALVDVRERELAPLLSPWPTRQLPVGDIWIGLETAEGAAAALQPRKGGIIAETATAVMAQPRKGGIIAERKTTDDLEASILDGRYREQRTRLTTYCKQTGARPLYIIEGLMDRLWGKLTEETLQKYLNRLMLRYGVAVIHTDSTEHTAALCRQLAGQMEADPTVFEATDPAEVSYTSTLSISKKDNVNPKTFASAALQGCPGVSAAVAEAVLAAFGGCLTGVWAADEAALAAVLVGKRRVGPAVAGRLWNNLHGGSSSAQ